MNDCRHLSKVSLSADLWECMTCHAVFRPVRKSLFIVWTEVAS
jgi:hypothetical protein